MIYPYNTEEKRVVTAKEYIKFFLYLYVRDVK